MRRELKAGQKPVRKPSSLARCRRSFTPAEWRAVKRCILVYALSLVAIVLHAFVAESSRSGLMIWVVPPVLCLCGCLAKASPKIDDNTAFGFVVTCGLLLGAGTLFATTFGPLAYVFACAASFIVGVGVPSSSVITPVIAAAPPPVTTFGSAQWGTLDYMIECRLVGDDGLILGVIPGEGDPYRLRYTGDRHLITFAPTGSGKGVTGVIPNLLTYRGATMVIDVKGENALITADARRAMGQAVHIVDPWGIASGAGSAARFNPLDWLKAGDANIAGNAKILADALVVPDGKTESFWDSEAKSLLTGFILYVATDEREAGHRHLGRVRDLLLLDGDDMPALFQRMAASKHHLVSSTGKRCLQKEEKLFSNVLASAQAQTDFLDDPHLRESLSASDFKFEDLKAEPMTIYLALPADRLAPFGRWLRLLIQQAITVNARNIAARPEKPILFILDEMPALGRLTMVQQAYDLMRGFGMQLWCIAQHAGQLREIYGESWEGFIANSGAIMYHGSLDNFTSDYFSKQCGMATVLNFSTTISSSFTRNSSYSSGANGGSSTSGSGVTSGFSSTTSYVQRKLIFADELGRLGNDMQLVRIENHRPILAGKLPWFEDRMLYRLGHNLRNKTPCLGVGECAGCTAVDRMVAALGVAS